MILRLGSNTGFQLVLVVISPCFIHRQDIKQVGVFGIAFNKDLFLPFKCCEIGKSYIGIDLHHFDLILALISR